LHATRAALRFAEALHEIVRESRGAPLARALRMNRILLVLSILSCLAGCKENGASPAAMTNAAPNTATPTPPKAVYIVLGVDMLKALPDKGFDGSTDQTVEFNRGFAQATYEKGKEKLAMLTVNDTAMTPPLKNDYAMATEKLAGNPFKSNGTKSSMLVADRFEVVCTSAKLDAAGRKRWLEKVDGAKLASFIR
jgi:hypothetical protein